MQAEKQLTTTATSRRTWIGWRRRAERWRARGAPALAAGVALALLTAPPGRAGGDSVRFDLRQDPARQGFHVEGADDGRFAWQRGRGLAVHLDSNAPGARYLAPLPFDLDGSASFVVEVDFEIRDVDASPTDFFQMSFGLVHAGTTGLNRTGTSLPSFPFFVDDSDCWDSVSFDYFPNVTAFGGPFLQPSVFGDRVGSPFANFAANFGSSSDLGDNQPGDPAGGGDDHRDDHAGDDHGDVGEGELTALPVGVPLRARLTYDSCRQVLVTTMLDVSQGRPVELRTGLQPVDVSFVNATATFHVDSVSFNASQDLADADPSTRSLLADVAFRAVRVEAPGPISAVLVPPDVDPHGHGDVTVRVVGVVGLEPGAAVPATLVEVDGQPTAVPLRARADGEGSVLVFMPRADASRPTVIDVAGCRAAVAASRRAHGTW